MLLDYFNVPEMPFILYSITGLPFIFQILFLFFNMGNVFVPFYFNLKKIKMLVGVIENIN